VIFSFASIKKKLLRLHFNLFVTSLEVMSNFENISKMVGKDNNEF
jgi:hypothetical protein